MGRALLREILDGPGTRLMTPPQTKTAVSFQPLLKLAPKALSMTGSLIGKGIKGTVTGAKAVGNKSQTGYKAIKRGLANQEYFTRPGMRFLAGYHLGDTTDGDYFNTNVVTGPNGERMLSYDPGFSLPYLVGLDNQFLRWGKWTQHLPWGGFHPSRKGLMYGTLAALSPIGTKWALRGGNKLMKSPIKPLQWQGPDIPHRNLFSGKKVTYNQLGNEMDTVVERARHRMASPRALQSDMKKLMTQAGKQQGWRGVLQDSIYGNGISRTLEPFQRAVQGHMFGSGMDLGLSALSGTEVNLMRKILPVAGLGAGLMRSRKGYSSMARGLYNNWLRNWTQTSWKRPWTANALHDSLNIPGAFIGTNMAKGNPLLTLGGLAAANVATSLHRPALDTYQGAKQLWDSEPIKKIRQKLTPDDLKALKQELLAPARELFRETLIPGQSPAEYGNKVFQAMSVKNDLDDLLEDKLEALTPEELADVRWLLGKSGWLKDRVKTRIEQDMLYPLALTKDFREGVREIDARIRSGQRFNRSGAKPIAVDPVSLSIDRFKVPQREGQGHYEAQFPYPKFDLTPGTTLGN
jgi:hypothetical protein